MNGKFRMVSIIIALLLIIPIITSCQTSTEEPTNEVVVEEDVEEKVEEPNEVESPEEVKEEKDEETTESKKLKIEVKNLEDPLIDGLMPYTAYDGTEVKPEISLPQIVIDYNDVEYSKDEIENFNN